MLWTTTRLGHGRHLEDRRTQSVTIVRSDAECLELEVRYEPHGNLSHQHFNPNHDERFEVVQG